MEFLIITIGAVALIGLLAGVLATLQGFVLVHLWAWFLVPLGLPPIGIAHAIGIALIAGMLAPRARDSKEKEEKKKLVVNLDPFLSPLLFLLFGYIVHLFM